MLVTEHLGYRENASLSYQVSIWLPYMCKVLFKEFACFPPQNMIM